MSHTTLNNNGTVPTWNCRSIFKKTAELRHFLEKYSVDVIGLRRKALTLWKVILFTYRPDTVRGGARLAISNIYHHPIVLFSFTYLIARGIVMHIGIKDPQTLSPAENSFITSP